MKLSRLGIVVYQLFFALALVGCGGGEAVAQYGTMRECQGTKGGTCVEVLLRYYETEQKTGSYSSKVVILDPQTRQELRECQICDPKLHKNCSSPCPQLQGTTVHDASSILLLQSHKSPGCYYMCSGGWCRWYCS